MDVVLLERIDKLGRMGDVVSVRPGHARNFLIPRGKALRASEENVARFEAERAEREAGNAERRGGAEDLASRIEGAHVTLIRQASDNLQLYGSVKARDIADGLVEQGFDIDRRNVVLSGPIKTLGLHTVTAMLHPEVSTTVIANVARTPDEARLQQETGKAVGRGGDEDDEADAEAPALEELVGAEAADRTAEDLAFEGEAPGDETPRDGGGGDRKA